MKTGDLVKEKYHTARVGIITFIGEDNGIGIICGVMFTDGITQLSYTHHFWAMNND